MAHKKLLFCTGEGIGNVIQTIPVIRTLKEVLGYEIDFWHAFGSFQIPKLIPYVDKWLVGRDILDIDPEDYVGKVSTYWTRDHLGVSVLPKIKLLNRIVPLTMIRSEVDTYMDIARDMGVKEEDIKPESKFVEDLGADSLDLVELIMAFEDKLGIEISDEEAEKMVTVKDVLNYIEKK